MEYQQSEANRSRRENALRKQGSSQNRFVADRREAGSYRWRGSLAGESGDPKGWRSSASASPYWCFSSVQHGPKTQTLCETFLLDDLLHVDYLMYYNTVSLQDGKKHILKHCYIPQNKVHKSSYLLLDCAYN